MTPASDERLDVSVIVPCYNATDTLPTLLESLRLQRTEASYEVIVVDNRSEDDIIACVKEWIGRLPSLRLVQASLETGVSYARNVGASAARAKRLLFCDADDVVSETWIGQAIRAFEAAELWSGAALPVMDYEFGTDVAALRKRIGDSDVWEGLADDQDGDFPILMGGDFGVCTEVFYELGGFDQSLPSAGEDNEFAVRARRKGYRIPIAPSVRIAYRIRSSSTARRSQQYRAAVAHALIATRYGLWRSSPHPRWSTALGRVAAATVRMMMQPSGRDWDGLAERRATAWGFTMGTFRYRYLRRTPAPRLGIGLDRTCSDEGENHGR